MSAISSCNVPVDVDTTEALVVTSIPIIYCATSDTYINLLQFKGSMLLFISHTPGVLAVI
jgi:hypothetical protein